MLDFFSQMPDVGSLIEFAEWRKGQIPEVPLQVNEAINKRIAAIILSPSTGEADYARGLLHGLSIINPYGRSDFFNESSWFNAGIAKALESERDWIIVMSDDLYNPLPEGQYLYSEILRSYLKHIDPKQTDVVWIDPRPDYYHSYNAVLAGISKIESFAQELTGSSPITDLRKKYAIEKIIVPEHPIKKPFSYWLFHTLYNSDFYKHYDELRLTSDFCILSANWCRRQGREVLNETFNGWEDMDLSMRLRKARSATIPFKIGSEIGGHFKPGLWKAMRETFNLAIFNEYLRRGKYN